MVWRISVGVGPPAEAALAAAVVGRRGGLSRS
jgi:hypothetical protein